MKIFITTALLFMSLGAWAKITKEQRVLVVISELDTGGLPEYTDLYTMLEHLTQVSVLDLLSPKYSDTISLFNDDATFANFKQTLRTMASNEDVQAIDVILSLHGLDKSLLFKDRIWGIDEMVDEMLAAESYNERDLVSKLKKKLRIMYNLSCFGASHNEGFYRMGFDVSNGSVDINANSQMEFLPAIRRLARGRGFKNAFFFSNNPIALFLADEPVRHIGRRSDNGLKSTNSKKLFFGFTKTNLSTEPREVIP